MANTYVAIAKSVLTSSAASVTFSSIVSTYTDLLLVASCRSDRASSDVDLLKIRFNGASVDTNLTSRIMWGDGTSSQSNSRAYAEPARINGSTTTSNTFSNVEIYLSNYANSTAKPISTNGVSENNATTAYATISAGLFNDTTAISSITLLLAVGPNFVSGSRFDLYGIKNS